MNPGKAARAAARAENPEHWTPPVIRTVASNGEGIGDVIEAADRHRGYLEKSGTLGQRRRARLRDRVVDVVEMRVRTRLWSDAETIAWLDARLPALQDGTTNPFAVADELLERSARLLTRNES